MFARFRIYSSVVRVYLLNKRDANSCDMCLCLMEFSVKMICSHFTAKRLEQVDCFAY